MALICGVALTFGVSSGAYAQEAEENKDSKDVWGSEYDKLDHVLVLDQLNQRADIVQTKIAVAQEQVDLLRESVILGAFEPSELVIVHRNDLTVSFSLESVTYKLDGATLMAKTSKNGALDEQLEFEIFNGQYDPGEHLLEVQMVVLGTGKGIYKGLKGYRFKIGSKYPLKVADGRLTKLTVVPLPRDDITAGPRNRIAVKYELDVEVAEKPKATDAEAPATPAIPSNDAPKTDAPKSDASTKDEAKPAEATETKAQ